MQEYRFQIGLPQRDIYEFMSGVGSVVEQSSNFSRMLNGEPSRAVVEDSAAFFHPGKHALVRSPEAGKHLAARGKSVAHQLFLRSQSNNAPMIDDGDAIAQPLRLFHVVCRVDH